MSLNAEDEPPIDVSLAHHLEERALAIAADKAATPAQRALVERLAARRQGLMQRRESFHRQAVAARHARGEIYSKARVAAINAIGPGRAEMDRTVQTLYQRPPDVEGVLKAHARSHFAFGLVSARLQLASVTPDIVEAAREMQAHEEAFAAAWVDAIADPAFRTELLGLQRDALRMLRTASRPMVLLTWPAVDGFDDADAAALGKAWSKLDDMAQDLGVEPLSGFIAVPGEDRAAALPASRLLAIVEALVLRVQTPGIKLPGKRATLLALTHGRDVLRVAAGSGGHACFDIDL